MLPIRPIIFLWKQVVSTHATGTWQLVSDTPFLLVQNAHTHSTVDFDAGVLRYCQEILFEIGFIEEMRTTCGNKEVPQTFFHYSEFLKYVLIRLTSSYHRWAS